MKTTLFHIVFFLALGVWVTCASADSPATIYETTLMESGQKTLEVSTNELRKILAEKSATVFDARPLMEYSMSHIPGAVNVSEKPGVPISQYVSDVAEVGRVVGNNRSAPIVLYCNGPFCGKSKRLSGAKSLPIADVKKAKDDGRLPMEDHNTRVIVFGRDGAQARAVTEAIAKEAFHNVSYFGGSFDELRPKIASK